MTGGCRWRGSFRAPAATADARSSRFYVDWGAIRRFVIAAVLGKPLGCEGISDRSPEGQAHVAVQRYPSAVPAKKFLYVMQQMAVACCWPAALSPFLVNHDKKHDVE